MHTSSRSLSRLLYLVSALILFGAGQAHARRGLMIITHGTGFSELGQVQPDKLKAMREEAGPGPMLDKVGWKYDYFGVFWLDLWNWGGEYCIFSGDTYYPVDKSVAAALAGVDESKLGKPLNYRMPYGLLVLAGLVSLKVVPRVIAKKRQAQSMAQYDPGRPAWTPQNPPPGAPGSVPPPQQYPSAGGPPPMPPPMPPE